MHSPPIPELSQGISLTLSSSIDDFDDKNTLLKVSSKATICHHWILLHLRDMSKVTFGSLGKLFAGAFMCVVII
jgi:hypothetical protein